MAIYTNNKDGILLMATSDCFRAKNKQGHIGFVYKYGSTAPTTNDVIRTGDTFGYQILSVIQTKPSTVKGYTYCFANAKLIK